MSSSCFVLVLFPHSDQEGKHLLNMFEIAYLRPQEILEGMIDIDLVVNLKLREDVLIEKCLGRRLCSQCGKNFNIASISVKGEHGNPAISMAPLLPPENCMSKLITRADDTEQVVRERLRIYNEKVSFLFPVLFSFVGMANYKDLCAKVSTWFCIP